jgi:EAL domain-containing protein (putative c-di-GMP-specific phosphodiesterase class I)
MDSKLTVAATMTGRQLALVQALMQLGHTLGVQMVAQGVETPEQLEALRRMGCELGQGSLLSQPLEPAQALAGQASWARMPPA